MISTIGKNIGNGFVDEEFNKTKQHINLIPNELFLEIFSDFNLATLGTFCCVSKEWKQLATHPILVKRAIYREIAFGNDKWARCFGEEVVKDENREEELASLPLDEFIKDCKNIKKIFPNKSARDSLMLVRLPKTLNGALALKSLGELAKKYFTASQTGYRHIWPEIVNELGKSIDKSCWVVMTKDILPKSRNKNYDQQQTIVGNLAQKELMGYAIPKTLEATVCILSQYFDSKMRLFSDSPSTYTRCEENLKGFQLVVGGFAAAGLVVFISYYDSDYDKVGVAALRKF